MFLGGVKRTIQVSLLFTFCGHVAYAGTDIDERFADWQRADNVCGGYYLPPIAPNADIDPYAPLDISADQSRLELDGNSLLWGDVRLTQDHRQLEANEAVVEYNPETKSLNKITVSGDIRFNMPGFQVIAEEATATQADNTIHLQHGYYRLYQRSARGEAEGIDIHADRTVDLKEALYTGCAPGSHSWYFTSQEAHLDPERGRGKAWNAWLRLGGVPVLYLPYLDFPLDDRRHSGFLYPSFGNTTGSGTVIALPYYWNLAPNYDAIVTLRGHENRGVELRTHGRYLTHQSTGNLDIRYLPNDQVYKRFRHDKRRSHPTISNLADPRIAGLGGTNRAAFEWHHQTDFDPSYRLNINYHAVSDDNFFVDLEDDIHGNNVANLKQELTFSQTTENWRNFIRFQRHQVLHAYDGPARTELYRREPQLAINGMFPDWTPWLIGNVSSEWTHFTVDQDNLTNETKTHGDRFHLRPGLTASFDRSYGFFRPALHWDITYYDLNLSPTDQSNQKPAHATRTIPMYEVRTGLFFDRQMPWRHHRLLSTLEPELYYLYVPFRDQNAYPVFDSGPREFSFYRLFTNNRYTSFDRIGDANQLTLGLTSRLLDMDSGHQRLLASLGQTLYFSDRLVSVCDNALNPSCRLRENPTADDPLSPFVAQLQFDITDKLSATGTLEWNHNLNAQEKSTVHLAYRFADDALWNINRQYLRVDPARTNLDTGLMKSLEQTAFSVYWPLASRWHGLGRWNYDHTESQAIDLLVGLEYETCCAAFQLVGTRYLKPANEDTVSASTAVTGKRRYDNAIYLQIQLKGLSTFGHLHHDKTLQKLIPGYPRFEQRRSVHGYRQP